MQSGRGSNFYAHASEHSSVYYSAVGLAMFLRCQRTCVPVGEEPFIGEIPNRDTMRPPS